MGIGHALETIVNPEVPQAVGKDEVQVEDGMTVRMTKKMTRVTTARTDVAGEVGEAVTRHAMAATGSAALSSSRCTSSS